jgi:hypothetical protein
MDKSLSAQLSAIDALDIDTITVENTAATSLTSSYGIPEFGASGKYFGGRCYCSCCASNR